MQQNKPPHRSKSVPETDAPEMIYGVHASLAALANPQRQITAVWASRNMADKFNAEIMASKTTPEILHPRQLDAKAGPDAVHQGLIIMAKPLPQPFLDQIPATGLVVLLDQVTDPHNVGAILRSCAAFSVTALIATARHSPQGSAILTKAASGAVEHVPFIKVTNLSRAMEELRMAGFTLVGLDSDGEEDFDRLEINPPCALVLGAEGKGLRHLTQQKCDSLARLTLPGAINSLNVSNAAVLALHCLHRATHNR